MVYDLFNVLLDSVSKYFVDNFYIYVHQGFWPVTFLLSFFFDASLPDFVRVILALLNEFDSLPSFYTL
jgi:hypothetical protein